MASKTKMVMPPNFVQRVVFWVAVLCLGWVVSIFPRLALYYGRLSTENTLLGQGGVVWVLVALTSVVMVLVGSLALLLRRRAGVVLVVAWAITQVGLNIASDVFYWINTAQRLTHLASVGMLLRGVLSSFVADSLFPLLVCVILLQKEVRQRWPRSRKGFEVIPLATAASTGELGLPTIESGASDLTKDEREA